ncbi:MAG: queuosine precursor transporter [Candidatus Hodarchaeales archaeon]|jgi:uncharacterized integral membrane protein (TIGR00697 family)
MFQTILLFIIVLFALLVLSILIGLYVRRYEKSELVIAIYVTFVLLAQVLATKLIEFDVNLIAPAGVILFPFTFQMTDTINEYFGQRETHKAIFIAFFTQLIMLFFFVTVTSLPGFTVVSEASNATEIWNSIFSFTFSITIASWIAFLISENIDAYLYQIFKRLTGGKYLWLRNIGSDAVSITIDSLIFTPLAFYVIPLFLNEPVTSTDVLISLIIGQSILKLAFGLLDSPFLYITRWLMYGELDDRFPMLRKLKIEH